ncbi:ribonuclease D [Magnetospira sp. QH-2]|uniref:ribonuclease D n=1 Tax=Magnetospira sp. (strain QH-2) TaxID=1288970 RepID=UPI0005F9BA4F|nr:ribonuclease D [Magnetospira sp. QH-2]
MPVIRDSQTLADFCAELAQEPYVTVDTEFLREKTYWPKLCLVQLGGSKNSKAVDPLAEGIDLTPLFDLMANEQVLKVFHAARQDLEIFFNLTGKVPHPLFDTQVAAMVCGFGDSVSYENLVAKLAKAKIDKSSRFTDWSKRPLTDKQIDYALADVIHLRPVFEKLRDRMEKSGRAHWLDGEMEILTSPSTYDPDLRTVYRRIKGRGAKPRTLAVLRELAAWREEAAQSRDIPRNRMLRDEALLEIAHHLPETVEALARVRGMSDGMAKGSVGKGVLAAVQVGLAVPKEDWPEAPHRDALPKSAAPISELLKVLLKLRCQEHDVAQKLLASADDVEQIAAYGEKAQVKTLDGWRMDLFGADALRLRRGELALAVKDGKARVVEV